MTVREELLAIKEGSADGLLHAPECVQWARAHPRSALHKALEWDNDKAAEDHRIWQVRQLIRLHIVTEDGTPQLVSLTYDRKREGGYREISEVVQSRTLYEILLADALAELERVQTKYARVQELQGVWQQVERARRRQQRRSAQDRPSAQAG